MVVGVHTPEFAFERNVENVSRAVREMRIALYQLVRQPGPINDRTFEITFLDPGVQPYSFTFG